jgi:hypothetical protein
MRTAGCISLILLCSQGFAQSFTENFDNIPALYSSGGWSSVNHSNPSNGNIWYTDQGNFTPYSGGTGSCISAGWYCTDTVGTGDASVWLFTPAMMLHNGDTISFYTISYNNAEYPDRLELRFNTTNTGTFVGAAETSVGDFTDLRLTINPALDMINYPMEWTKYSVFLNAIPGGATMGRIAFRYVVPNTGGSGINGSVVAIDNFKLRSVLESVEEEKNTLFSVSPNPATDLVQVQGHEMLRTIVLKNIQGKTCRTISNINSDRCKIELQDMPAGLYLLEVESLNGISSRKIIKN